MRHIALVCILVTAATACKKPADKSPSGAAAVAPDFHDPASPAFATQAPDSFRARFRTSRGEFVIAVHRAWAPRGADRFYNLVRSGYYGDTGVTAAWRERRIPDAPVRRTNIRSMVTFATAGAGTRTTQVFINYRNNDQLDAMGFAPFGEVVEGMQVVDSLYGGYGDAAPRGRGPDQYRMHVEGEKYLARQFPKLDKVIKATIE